MSAAMDCLTREVMTTAAAHLKISESLRVGVVEPLTVFREAHKNARKLFARGKLIERACVLYTDEAVCRADLEKAGNACALARKKYVIMMMML